VQSTAGSRGVRISGSNAGYTMFRGSVKSTGYPLHSPVSPSLPFPCVTVCHHISTGLYYALCYRALWTLLQRTHPSFYTPYIIAAWLTERKLETLMLRLCFRLGFEKHPVRIYSGLHTSLRFIWVYHYVYLGLPLCLSGFTTMFSINSVANRRVLDGSEFGITVEVNLFFSKTVQPDAGAHPAF